MADNEKFTIDRSDLTSGNYDTAEQITVTTEGEAPVSPPETVIAIILAGLIRSGAVSGAAAFRGKEVKHREKGCFICEIFPEKR